MKTSARLETHVKRIFGASTMSVARRQPNAVNCIADASREDEAPCEDRGPTLLRTQQKKASADREIERSERVYRVARQIRQDAKRIAPVELLIVAVLLASFGENNRWHDCNRHDRSAIGPSC